MDHKNTAAPEAAAAMSVASQPISLPQAPVASSLALRFKGNVVARWVLRRLGWCIEFAPLPARQGIIVAYPHTSNWDFPVAILYKWAVGLPLKFWGKDSLFKVPGFGRWLRWVGGVPVKQQGGDGAVGQMLVHLQTAQAQDSYFWLALSPEGTRKYAPGWRSGFYRLAVATQVPVAAAFIDWHNKRIGFTQFHTLSGDAKADFAWFAAQYTQVGGYTPANAAPVELLAGSAKSSGGGKKSV